MTTCCLPWPIVWPCDDLPEGATDLHKAAAQNAAQRLIWSRTGRRLGLCETTEQYAPVGGGTCGVPYLDDDRIWHNGGRGGACCSIFLALTPVQLIREVKVNGVVIDASGYRLDRPSMLTRVGACWPAASSCDAPTVEVTYVWGVPIATELWGLVAIAMGEVTFDLLTGMCGGHCRMPARLATASRSGVTVNVATDLVGYIGLPMADQLIDSVNPAHKTQASRVYSPDMAQVVRPAAATLPSSTNIGGVSTVPLPDAYEGDVYQFSLTFPDASYLAGGPGVVAADIKVDPDDVAPAASFTPTINGAVLTLTLDPNTLAPGSYWTDVSVAGVTYLYKTPLVVREQVS